MKSIGKEQATQEVIEILSDKLTAEEKTTARALVANLTAEPAPEQIDAIYTLLASKEPADK